MSVVSLRSADFAARPRSSRVSQVAATDTRQTSVAERVYVSLLDAIVLLELLPGQKLPRKELADMLGVSVTPVRDALQRLETQGFVSTKPQSETRVSLLDKASLLGLQFQRAAMEVAVVRRLARRPAAVSNLSAVPKHVSAVHFDAHDDTFHHGLFQAAGLGQVHDALQTQLAPLRRCQNVVPMSGGDQILALDFHRQITDRVGAGDMHGAESAMRAHLSADCAAIGKAARQFPEWFC